MGRKMCLPKILFVQQTFICIIWKGKWHLNLINLSKQLKWLPVIAAIRRLKYKDCSSRPT